MTRGIRVARLAGVDVVADVSVVGIAALLAWALFVDLSARYPFESSARLGILAVAGSVIFLMAILAHEWSHALVARRRGLTVRLIALFVFGGYSVIEPGDETPADEIVVSVAGPIASLAIGGVLAALAAVVPAEDVTRVLTILALANVAVAAFNLLPGLPLDGGRILRAALWRRRGDRVAATERAVQWGRVLGLVVVGSGIFALLRFRNFSGIWLVVVGWFLFRAAATAGRRETLAERMSGLTASDVMRQAPDAVPGMMAVSDLVETYQSGPRLRSLPVEVDGRVRGLIGEKEIERLSPGRRQAARVSAVMSPIGPGDVAEAAMPLERLLARASGPTGRVVVVEEGRVVGIIEGPELAALFEVEPDPAG